MLRYWRAIMRRILSAISLMSLFAIGGCQSWSQVGQGLPNGSRVAPPGTGTYNVPSNYYNGPKAGTASTAAPNGNVSNNPLMNNNTGRTAGFNGQAQNEVVPAAYQLPTVDQLRSGINNTAGAVLNDVSNRANQAIQTGTARAASAVQQYSPPPYDNSAPAFAAQNSASQSISDSAPPTTSDAAPPKLDWQSPR